MEHPELFDPEQWSLLGFPERRERLAVALLTALEESDAVAEVVIEAGTVGREYDLTAMVETDVGRLRTPLWSHARASVFCDPSVHVANRMRLAPGHAVREAAERLRARLAVPFALESRGLTVTMTPAEGVERTWTAEHSRFRKRTAVTREDRVQDAGDEDVRDLLGRFYQGPSLRLVGEDGSVFLLPEASEAEGPLVSLCHACGRWSEGAHAHCPDCGGTADIVIAARPPRR
jgi:hypothetical protein